MHDIRHHQRVQVVGKLVGVSTMVRILFQPGYRVNPMTQQTRQFATPLTRAGYILAGYRHKKAKLTVGNSMTQFP